MFLFLHRPSRSRVCRCSLAGATIYTHVFQPLGSGMMRLGQMGQVHNAMFNFDRKTGAIKYEFDGDILLHGETDGSSYQNGGMRATHTAGGYTALDPSCPMFIRGDTVFIPTVRAFFCTPPIPYTPVFGISVIFSCIWHELGSCN